MFQYSISLFRLSISLHARFDIIYPVIHIIFVAVDRYISIFSVHLGILLIQQCYKYRSGVPVATFKHHKAPITSVEWDPRDSSVFAASGSDDQLTLWDLAVERDDGDQAQGKLKDLPPQLLFIHMVCFRYVFES